MKHLNIILGFLFVSAFAKAQQLESYIREAEQNNPQIQAVELRYNIAKEKTNEVQTLPNTKLSAGYFVSEPETRTGAQRAKFSIQQMLPWFGTITARENYSNAMAEAEYVDIAITKRKLALSVSQSYYILFELYAKQKVLDENIQLLQTYERLALTSVEVGKASVVDVLRLQIRQNELQQRKAVLKQDFMAEQTAFNTLMNRDADIAVVIFDEMTIPKEDAIVENQSLAFNPEVLKYDKLYESIQQSELLNQKESAPQFGFGLDYIPVSERADVDISDNGKDIIMPMMSLSIPIFNKRYDSKTRQNELRRQEITVQKAARQNRLTSLLAKAISNRNNARIQNETQIKNLQQARDAEQILTKSYETGTIDFDDLLDIQELQLKFQLNQIESIQQYYKQTAIINYLTN